MHLMAIRSNKATDPLVRPGRLRPCHLADEHPQSGSGQALALVRLANQSFAKVIPGQHSWPLQDIPGPLHTLALREVLGIAGGQQVHGSVSTHGQCLPLAPPSVHQNAGRGKKTG